MSLKEQDVSNALALAPPASNPNNGHRITPRTCLWPLAGSLVLTFGLSIGLTFRSNHHCYAGTCGEWLFPLQARLHVVIWYSWLSLSVTFLAVRAFHPEMQKHLNRPLTAGKIPLLGKRMTFGGALMPLWILALYGVVFGVWWVRLSDYFDRRNAAAGIHHGSNRLAAIALTGHLCDITMGMVLLPISRHSALASFFKIAVSTTLTNHVLTAYVLFTLVLVHGLLYVSWVAAFTSLSTSLRRVVPLLNPTYLYAETWPGNTTSLGIWRASLIFTGSISAIIMLLIFLTTFPRIRARNFNLFYFTHLLSILMVIIVCLHASTMFYCTAPGLAMWVLDWGMRLHELRQELEGSIEALGRGWYIITLPLPRIRLKGCSYRSPLAHFYLHHADSSIRELHPFTTITHLASENSSMPATSLDVPIRFLFRKQGNPTTTTTTTTTTSQAPSPKFYKRLLPGETPQQQQQQQQQQKQKQKTTQWTNRLAALADNQTPSSPNPTPNPSTPKPPPPTPLTLRLEGPYFSPADPSRYDTVICLVAGTGITGAIAIASAFRYARRERLGYGDGLAGGCDDGFGGDGGCNGVLGGMRWKRCVILWSVRAGDWIDVEGVVFRGKVGGDGDSGLVFRRFLTGGVGGGGRVDVVEEVRGVLSCGGRGVGGEGNGMGKEKEKEREKEREKVWVYISGPGAYVGACKDACKRVRDGIGTGVEAGMGAGLGVEMDVYVAD